MWIMFSDFLWFNLWFSTGLAVVDASLHVHVNVNSFLFPATLIGNPWCTVHALSCNSRLPFTVTLSMGCLLGDWWTDEWQLGRTPSLECQSELLLPYMNSGAYLKAHHPMAHTFSHYEGLLHYPSSKPTSFPLENTSWTRESREP